MGKIIVVTIGILLVLIGVIMIYDARKITKKFFGFGDQNEGALGMKMTGFCITMVGAFILLFQ